MNNKVTVTIANLEYTLTAPEEDGYIEKVGAFVDEKVRQVMTDSRASLTDGAVLTAVNITDLYFKERVISENLRIQMKNSMEELAKLQAELSEAKRELFGLERENQKLSSQLSHSQTTN
jgi:cell division protein ZapA